VPNAVRARGAEPAASRLALVADDQRLAGAIQAHLSRALGQGVFHCNLPAIRAHLARDTDGLLLLACGTGPEADDVLRLVQEIILQRLPPILVTLETEEAARGRALDRLDPYVAARFRWPEDAGKLAAFLRERAGRVRDFLGASPGTVEEVIARRLLLLTPSLLPLVERIALAAIHDVTVLLTGETGTGKTFLARLMHDCSPRHKEPFLVVPCGAQPANLVESAFFGHVKGAFTGATDRKVGKFEAAGNGTLLLDEIDTLGLEQQASLLRVLETGEFEPVGSNETRRCTARIIVASNWDLEAAVRHGKFRQDLYYRLNVMSFHLPPLRERMQDIAPLVRGMAARFNTKFKKDLLDLTTRALDALEGFPWPGNIRQLENVVQQAVLLSSGPELLYEHLPQQVRDHCPAVPQPLAAHPDSLLHNREALERALIVRALSTHGYSRSRTADALGISRVTLYKKMKKYGLMEAPRRPGNRAEETPPPPPKGEESPGGPLSTL
jgi:DNA-binding NtrC family response regulator